MRGFFLICIAVCLTTGCLSFLILFEGDPTILKNWWQEKARNSESLPFAPYNSRVVSSSEIRIDEANEVIIIDQHLFWKGTGARIQPILNEDNTLIEFAILKGGSGYSNIVKAKIQGAGSSLFELKPPVVKNGAIVALPISKTATWNEQPLVYASDEKYPFSGLVESQFPGGQIIEQTPYLSGKIHGTKKRWNEYGIPLYSHDYINGMKHGTHIYWYNKPIDPTDYKPVIGSNGDLLPTLWFNILDQAKTKFGTEFGSNEANKWVVDKFKLEGGSFQVKLLEHWKNNLKHGLFEGFDSKSNKTFKDEYKMGLRVKHKTFDKTKG